MISNIHIENIALIDSLDLQLGSQMNVFTGETGAGKSIIIDSINLALGGRANRDLIRTDSPSGYVSILLCDLSDAIVQKLLDIDIDITEDNQLLLEREIFSDGKNICKINSRPTTTSLLKEVGSLIINIHGQHDSIGLIKTEKHILLLDTYAKLEDRIKSYQDSYSEYKTIKKELEALDLDKTEKERQVEYLNYCIDEIRSANLKAGEDNELSMLKKRFSNAKKISSAIEATYAYIYEGGEFGDSARDLIYSSKSELSNIQNTDESIADYITRFDNIYYELEDIALSLNEFKNSFEFLESDIDNIILRLDLISKLKKKFGSTIDEILEFLKQCEQKLDTIIFSDQNKQKLEEKLFKQEIIVCDMAKNISKKRADFALLLEEKITDQLEFLEMSKVKFKVNIETFDEVEKFNQIGADKVEFLISPNLGEDLKPLSKIASGGELSRIMLAIINVLSDSDTTATLIFDEIDTGISGRAANAVAKRLYDISKHKQVLCVTHLSQIAVMGDYHFYIEKNTKYNRTETKVSVLDEEQRKTELARITGGVNITDLTLKNARQMIDFANQYKNESRGI